MNIPEGVIIRESPYNVEETTKRLVYFLQMRGIKLYARIDQQAELRKNGLEISPLEFIMFGNPKVGGPVMLENALAALDLPLKIIVYEESAGETRIAYNDFRYFGKRYSLNDKLIDPLDLDLLVTNALMS